MPIQCSFFVAKVKINPRHGTESPSSCGSLGAQKIYGGRSNTRSTWSNWHSVKVVYGWIAVQSPTLPKLVKHAEQFGFDQLDAITVQRSLT